MEFYFQISLHSFKHISENWHGMHATIKHRWTSRWSLAAIGPMSMSAILNFLRLANKASAFDNYYFMEYYYLRVKGNGGMRVEYLLVPKA